MPLGFPRYIRTFLLGLAIGLTGLGIGFAGYGMALRWLQFVGLVFGVFGVGTACIAVIVRSLEIVRRLRGR